MWRPLMVAQTVKPAPTTNPGIQERTTTGGGTAAGAFPIRDHLHGEIDLNVQL